MRRMAVACLILVISVGCNFSFAAETRLSPDLENRARVLFLELRCVVCQNQSIGDSDADVAKDLREIVREQITAGKSDVEIKQFLVDRYGEFILLKPVFAWHTLFLWAAPIVLLLFGGLIALRSASSRKSTEKKATLTRFEEEELAEIIGKKDP